MQNNFSLESRIYAEGVFSNSDHHGNLEAFENGLRYSQQNKLVYVHSGDLVNDYSFAEKTRELGILSPEEYFEEYSTDMLIKGEISMRDLEAFSILSLYSSSPSSLEDLLSQVPSESRDEALKQIQQILSYSQTDAFQGKMTDFLSRFERERGEDIQRDVFRMRAFYDVLMDEEARGVARSLNKYSDVTFAMVLGNHENSNFVEQVRKYLTNKEQIICLNDIGHVEVINSQNESLKIAGMTNCVSFMPYLTQIFSEDELKSLYKHMTLDENQYTSLLYSNSTEEELENTSDLVARDKEYRRIKNNLEGKLDIFVSHGQVGKPMVKSGKVFDVPYLASAAQLSKEAELTIEGHLHSEYEGKNSLGRNMVRPTGGRGVVIKKENGVVKKSQWFEVDSSFDGNHTNKLPYPTSYLSARIEDLLKRYKLLDAKVAANDEFIENSKAA